MKVIKAIELDEKERQVICDYFKLLDQIADAATCTMSDVYNYFILKADILADGNYSITTVHQIADIAEWEKFVVRTIE